jgi:hypothetical protein
MSKDDAYLEQPISFIDTAVPPLFNANTEGNISAPGLQNSLKRGSQGLVPIIIDNSIRKVIQQQVNKEVL